MAAPRNRETHHVKPAHHTKMLADCIAKGWIKRVGDSYEITPAGHEHTMRLTHELLTVEQPPLPGASTFEATPAYKRWS